MFDWYKNNEREKGRFIVSKNKDGSVPFKGVNHNRSKWEKFKQGFHIPSERGTAGEGLSPTNVSQTKDSKGPRLWGVGPLASKRRRDRAAAKRAVAISRSDGNDPGRRRLLSRWKRPNGLRGARIGAGHSSGMHRPLRERLHLSRRPKADRSPFVAVDAGGDKGSKGFFDSLSKRWNKVKPRLRKKQDIVADDGDKKNREDNSKSQGRKVAWLKKLSPGKLGPLPEKQRESKMKRQRKKADRQWAKQRARGGKPSKRERAKEWTTSHARKFKQKLKCGNHLPDEQRPPVRAPKNPERPKAAGKLPTNTAAGSKKLVSRSSSLDTQATHSSPLIPKKTTDSPLQHNGIARPIFILDSAEHSAHQTPKKGEVDRSRPSTDRRGNDQKRPATPIWPGTALIQEEPPTTATSRSVNLPASEVGEVADGVSSPGNQQTFSSPKDDSAWLPRPPEMPNPFAAGDARVVDVSTLKDIYGAQPPTLLRAERMTTSSASPPSEGVESRSHQPQSPRLATEVSIWASNGLQL